MSLDESWDAYRARLRTHFGLPDTPETDDWLTITTAIAERDALRSGQLRYGAPGDWFSSIAWSGPAWTALHGADGPRHQTMGANGGRR